VLVIGTLPLVGFNSNDLHCQSSTFLGLQVLSHQAFHHPALLLKSNGSQVSQGSLTQLGLQVTGGVTVTFGFWLQSTLPIQPFTVHCA
jgi:hypothetical protein